MRRVALIAALVVVALTVGLLASGGHAAPAGTCAGFQQCELVVTVNGSGMVTGPSISCPGDCVFQTKYPGGFTITATPDPGQYFHGWSGNYGQCGPDFTKPTCFINLGGQYPDYQTVTATFTSSPPPGSGDSLSVSKAGTGSGTVASNPAGIDCGATCSASFASSTSVTLTATPDAASTFTGWTGDCTGTGTCTLTMDANKSATATFTGYPKVTVAKGGNGSGTVVSTPAGIDCGATCAAPFTPGSQVLLAATADTTSLFTGWQGACTGAAATCSITASADEAASALFFALPSISRPLAKARKVRGCAISGPLPDRQCSPGAIYIDASLPLVCAPGYTAKMNNVPAAEQRAVYAEYGIPRGHYGRPYEIDHIVPIELGGSNAITNLYPEAASNPSPGFHVKDKLEQRLHKLVCANSKRLRTTQNEIAANWTKLYKSVFGSAPT